MPSSHAVVSLPGTSRQPLDYFKLTRNGNCPACNLSNPNSKKSACPLLEHLTLGPFNDNLCWSVKGGGSTGFLWVQSVLGHLGTENDTDLTTSPAADQGNGQNDQSIRLEHFT